MFRTPRLAIGCLWAGLTLLAPRSLPAAAAERGVSLRLKVPGGRELPLYSESHALVIGASDYTNGWPSLPGVKEDVAAVKAALQRQGFQMTTLLNPTHAELDRALRDFVSDHGQAPEARLVVYFAGHGHTLKTPDGRDLGYVVPVDAPLPKLDKGGFKKLAISMNDVETVALQIESKHVLFLFDSCFSGSIFDVTRSVPDDISEKTARPVRQFITSGSADQTVPDRSEFRRQLVAALEGEGDLNGDGYLTGSELGQFLESKVTNYSHRSQTPQYGKIRYPTLDKGDFVFETPAKAAGKGRPPASTAESAPAPAPPGIDVRALDLAYWQAIQGSQDPETYRSYLERYPNGEFATLAKLKLKDLATPNKVTARPSPAFPTPLPEGGTSDRVIVMNTSLGSVRIELYPDKAPETVRNFLRYVDDRFYDGTIFHRVINGFMIQGGGYDSGLVKKVTRGPIKNEAGTGVRNVTGTISMARTSDPASATSQFFINVNDNAMLDYRSNSNSEIGYCAFGKVIGGMDVVDRIRSAPTGTQGGMQNVPTTPVIIESIRRGQ